MSTYPTSNDQNFLTSGQFFFTKKASSFRLKKDISIDFWSCKPHTDEWRERSHWKLVGWNKHHNNAQLHDAEIKGQCCDKL